ncbi:Unconventional myosin-Va [Blattella germanica]|nr:Unconventional myosin-Va [Blattella germanica]
MFDVGWSSLVRKWIARRLYKKLKLEARSLEHVKKLNKGLENKIISLQQRIEELVKENNILKSTQHELAELRIKLDSMKGLESDVKRITITLNTKEKELDILLKTLEQERDEKMDIMNEKERIEKEHKGEIEKINNENVKLKAELDEMNEKMKSNQIGAEEILKSRLEEEKRFLIREHDQDRDAYQKLLADYNSLEQRHEAMEKQISRLQRGGVNASGAKKGHHRSLSNASTASATSTSELPDDDYGYGSVRSTASASSTGSHQKLDNIDWNQQGRRSETVSPEGQRPPEQIDVGLVLKLQQKLKDVEKERNRLQERVEYLEKDSPSDDAARTHDAFKVWQLEASQLELDRRREECIQLHSVLANQTKGLKSVASNNYSSHVDIINEDGELVLAFEAQKKINRQLEDELQSEKTRWQAERKEFLQEIERLKEDNDRQQKLLSVNLTMSPQTQTEAFMQHEITRLASENLLMEMIFLEQVHHNNNPCSQQTNNCENLFTMTLQDLQEKYDALSEQCRKYRKQIKLLAKKLKDVGVVEAVEGSEAVPSPGSLLPQDQHSNLPVVRKKERDYMGMFDYRKEDESIIVKHLIYEKNIRVYLPLKYTESLLTVTINTIKKVIKKRHEDLDTTVLWLSNTLRLLHNLKQYSGDKSFQSENTLKQNDQCLRNFDLSEYRQVLSDIAVWIYQGVIRHLEERVQPMIVPAILEHEAISGLSGQKPGGMRGRASSVVREPESPVDIQKALDTLLQELTAFHRSLGFHGVDPELIVQVFRQGVIHHLEERVQPMIVPAILEHEAISGLSGQNLGGMRGRASSVVREPESPVDIQKALDTLLQELTAFHRSFGFHGVDPELIVQVFRQVGCILSYYSLEIVFYSY